MGKVSAGPMDKPAFEELANSIDPDWIEEALEATDTATIRKRRISAPQVVWLVIAMALFRHLSITDIVEHLQLVLPGPKKQPAASGIAQRRAKLGPEPLKWLFEVCARRWAKVSAEAWNWRGLSLYGIDGTTLRVPDSNTNRETFGSQGSGRGDSGYPLVRLVTLMALRSHILLAARFGPFSIGERTHAPELIGEVPDDALLIVDRNFAYAAVLVPVTTKGTNRHWLTRARKDHAWTVTKKLGPGDELAEIAVGRESRRENPWLPERWAVRVLKYRRRGFREQRLLTSLLDPVAYPADEIRALYHERWEIELGFDEVKTEMLDRMEAIRSQTPAGVAQELWGLGLAYNLVRLQMEKAAQIAGVPPVRMSFKSCFMAIRAQLVLFAAMKPGRLPTVVEGLPEDISHLVLPERRSTRRYPRAVKIKMSNYPRKRPPAPRMRRPAK